MSTPTATNEKQQQQLITMMQAQNRERFYGPIKFNSSGALQPANAMDERMIREKYGEDEEMNELERELLNGEKKNNDKERSKLGDVKSNNQKVVLAGAVVGLGGAVQAVARKANTNSNSTSSDSPSQSRLGKAKHQQQMHSLLLNNNNNNNNNNTNNGSHESTDGGGNNNNNNGTNTSAAAVTAFEKKQDSGSGGSNKISASNESKLLLQNDVDNNDGSDNMKSNNNNREDDNKNNNNNNNNNNTSNEESDKSNQQNVDSERNTTITTGNEKMLMIKENETNENAAEMNETDLLCDFDMEKQQIATPRRRKAKSKSTTKNNVLLVGSKRKVTLTNEEKTIEVIEAKKQQQQQQRDLLKRSGKNEGENNSKKKRKANEADNNNCNSEEKNKNSSSEDENDDSDNDNIKCFDNNREQRQQQKRSNDNSRDTSSGDTIIDEEGAKNANLLFGCDNLFVPPVAALFKPKQNAVLHKSGPENLDVNDGTNAKKFGTNGKEMNTINDSLYDQQFQIEPERLSARPGTDDSFRWFDPSSRAVATLGRSGSDEGEQYEPTTTTAMNKRRSNNININDKKATTTTTTNNNNNNNNRNNKNESDNSSFHEERRRRRSSEEGSDDVDISNELSDEEVYEADYEDKERLIDDLEDDLGENNNNHPVRSKLPYSRNVAGTTTTTTTTLLTNGRRAQRGRPPKNMTLAPPRVAVKKSMKVSAASKNTNSKSTTTSFAKLTTIRAVSKAPDSGEVKRKVKQNAKMFDELGEYTVAKVENGGMMESSKKSSGGSSLKQKSTGDDGAKSNDNKAVGKRNLSSIVGKSGSDNQNKRAAFGVRSGDTTKSVSKSVSSGVSEGFQQQGNNETNAAEGGPRRSKHHNPWSLEEAQALITGVITCGGGKWADIKKLGYREIEHRTAVDLKDKWRNLLRIATLPSAAAPLVRDSASNKSASGDRKREIPRAMLDKVRELALLHAKNKERELKLKST